MERNHGKTYSNDVPLLNVFHPVTILNFSPERVRTNGFHLLFETLSTMAHSSFYFFIMLQSHLKTDTQQRSDTPYHEKILTN